MEQFLDQYFPVDFLTDYLENSTDSVYRFRTYTLYRFFVAASKMTDETAYAKKMQDQFQATLNEDILTEVWAYLDKDCFFSPSFRENSFDILYMYYALMAQNSDAHTSYIYSMLANLYPALEIMDFSQIDNEAAFYGCLYMIAQNSPSQLPAFLPIFFDVYKEEYHFTCEDFIVYNFMDEYFEIKNCRNNAQFKELIDTLTLATLQSFDTTIEQCAMTDALPQLLHPYSRFAGIIRTGAMDATTVLSKEATETMLTRLFEYAVTYELRNNLFDFHLDDDRIITLENWKDKLRWYNTQYNNVFEQVVATFYTAALSRKLLTAQFVEAIVKLA